MSDSGQLGKFFAELDTRLNTLAELRDIYDEQMAFNFNATSFFWPNENTTSNILAFLLNPRSNHGQKEAFLRVFCETLLPERSEYLAKLNCHAVRRERQTEERRRIDIVIELGQGKEIFLVGIENKIWASDQNKQLSDYAEELKEKSGGHFCLFYLNPTGHDPSDGSISPSEREALGENLQIISYKEDVIGLFEKFIAVCKSDKVSAFLRDFQHYLRIQYDTGAWNMDDNKTIAEFITRDKNNITLALQIANNISSVKEHLYKIVQDELKTWAKETANGPKIDCHSLSQAGKKDAYLIALEQKEWKFFLAFGESDWRTPLIIIEWKEKGPAGMAFLREIQNDVGYHRENTVNTNISEYVDIYRGSWATTVVPWLDMAQNGDGKYSKFTMTIIDWYDKALKAINAKLGK